MLHTPTNLLCRRVGHGGTSSSVFACEKLPLATSARTRNSDSLINHQLQRWTSTTTTTQHGRTKHSRATSVIKKHSPNARRSLRKNWRRSNGFWCVASFQIAWLFYITDQALADPNTDAKDKGKQKERQRAEDSEHDPAHEAKEDEFNEESEGESEVWIPGAVKATGLFPAHEFLSPVSHISLFIAF